MQFPGYNKCMNSAVKSRKKADFATVHLFRLESIIPPMTAGAQTPMLGREK